MCDSVCDQVTPAHDPNDFKTGKRHALEFINIFDDSGAINDQGGPFVGQPRFKVQPGGGGGGGRR